MIFTEKLARSVERSDSLLCIGLDSEISKLPSSVQDQFSFNKAIIDATHDVVCAYKPNPAFYEALGAEGVIALKKTCDYLRTEYPEIPIIIDAKRGDIGNTNAGYVQYVFDYLGGDAVTVPPYMGGQSLEVFLERADKGIIVLCRTSNVGSGEIQDMVVEGEELYAHVARRVATAWNKHGNCGLVVGATYPDELEQVRGIVGAEMPILVPGVGAQGGDARQVVAVGGAMMINASRAVIFASDGADFAAAARSEATKLGDEFNLYRKGNK